MLRAPRPRRRRAPLHRADRHLRRRAARAARRLAGARGRAVLPGHRGPPRGRAAPPADLAPRTGTSPACRTRCSTSPASRPPASTAAHVVVGEGALFASLDAARSGRMRDIVATIQADQDEVIRAPLAGVLVVQGGPGTGKTAVALHRTAFLLYANRERIARSGVLLVGPNRVFLRYIDQVLPALGEADAVVMATPGELYPGVVATADEAPRGRGAQGRPADGRGDRPRGRAPAADDPARPRRSTSTARRSGCSRGTSARRARPRAAPARRTTRRGGRFVSEVLRGLVRTLAEPAGHRARRRDPRRAAGRALRVARRAPRGQPVLAADHAAAAAARPVRRTRPARRGRRPAADARRARAAAPRPRTAPWTAADVPLLDEAAELLGEDDAGGRGRPARRPRPSAGPRSTTPREVQDTFGGAEFGTAEELAGRYTGRSSLGQRRRAGGRRPHLGLRARRRRRGAGAVADGVAAADAPVPVPLVHRRRRRRADRLGGRGRLVGGRARAARRDTLAAGRADRQLPHARSRSWISPPRCCAAPARRCGRRRRPGSGARSRSSPAWPTGVGRVRRAGRRRRAGVAAGRRGHGRGDHLGTPTHAAVAAAVARARCRTASSRPTPTRSARRCRC